MSGDEEEEDDRESFDSLREQVEQVLDNAKNLLEQEVELENALLNEGPGIVSDLTGILIRIMRPITVPLTYSSQVERCVNTIGVTLLDGKVSLFLDGNMCLNGQNPQIPVKFVPELLQDQPRLEVFLQLLENLVQHFVDAVERIDQGRMSGVKRIDVMKEKLKSIN